MEQELEKLRIVSKELDKMKDERNSTNYQLSEQTNEIQMLKETVTSNWFYSKAAVVVFLKLWNYINQNLQV